MKRLAALVISAVLAVCVLLPLRAEACPMGDEFGRRYNEIWNEDFSLKTLFYSMTQHFYRREQHWEGWDEAGDWLNWIPADFTNRESFTFPLTSKSHMHMFTVWDENWENSHIEFPEHIEVGGTGFFLVVGLENMSYEFGEFAELDELFFDIMTKRLHEDETSNAHRKISENNFTLALPHILEITPGLIAENMAFTEITEVVRGEFTRFKDPVTVAMFREGGEIDAGNLAAINISNPLAYKLEVSSLYHFDHINGEGYVYYFEITEAGTYVIVENNFADGLLISGIEEPASLPENPIDAMAAAVENALIVQAERAERAEREAAEWERRRLAAEEPALRAIEEAEGLEEEAERENEGLVNILVWVIPGAVAAAAVVAIVFVKARRRKK